MEYFEEHPPLLARPGALTLRSRAHVDLHILSWHLRRCIRDLLQRSDVCLGCRMFSHAILRSTTPLNPEKLPCNFSHLTGSGRLSQQI